MWERHFEERIWVSTRNYQTNLSSCTHWRETQQGRQAHMPYFLIKSWQQWNKTLPRDKVLLLLPKTLWQHQSRALRVNQNGYFGVFLSHRYASPSLVVVVQQTYSVGLWMYVDILKACVETFTWPKKSNEHISSPSSCNPVCVTQWTNKYAQEDHSSISLLVPTPSPSNCYSERHHFWTQSCHPDIRANSLC